MPVKYKIKDLWVIYLYSKILFFTVLAKFSCLFFYIFNKQQLSYCIRSDIIWSDTDLLINLSGHLSVQKRPCLQFSTLELLGSVCLVLQGDIKRPRPVLTNSFYLWTIDERSSFLRRPIEKSQIRKFNQEQKKNIMNNNGFFKAGADDFEELDYLKLQPHEAEKLRQYLLSCSGKCWLFNIFETMNISAEKAKQEKQSLCAANNNNNNNEEAPNNYHNSIYHRQNASFNRQRNFNEQEPTRRIEIENIKKENDDESIISNAVCKKRQRGKPKPDQSVRNASTPAHILSFQQVRLCFWVFLAASYKFYLSRSLNDPWEVEHMISSESDDPS